jgi:hypothetical protein
MSAVCEIELTRGYVALVDAQDVEFLQEWKWYARLNNGIIYAGSKIGERYTFMHRLILSAAKGLGVDHRNGNGLDNRRSNLRLATNSQNQMNRGLQRNNTSGFKGVSFDRRRGLWMAKIYVERKYHFLGYFSSPKDVGVDCGAGTL